MPSEATFKAHKQRLENLNSQDVTWEFKAMNQMIDFYCSPYLKYLYFL